ncbi:dihydrolipoamide dehydrogenase [Sulfurivirga caldicuralii]|uniref:Dihydrolipoyl dehydrogenase n=1 Tax=Sulfurivirga caldicuralii TaxID=364032 RepID=A0A1N6EWY2_9GAMM|nr:dihydrolipoyl dehydrogenase [Sulfurivirga caldicuralii]SIN87496.1 dihydrolipoamide dehydrogenase [Sulfurivirga caldicuralii]
MSKIVDIVLPDIGDFDAVDVIEVLVQPGDTVEVDDSLITLESDKATMEVPSPHAGEIVELTVKEGDKVSTGDVIGKMALADSETVENSEKMPETAEEPAAAAAAEKAAAQKVGDPLPEADQHAEVLVLGGGPGGYTAAFRAADLGKKVVLVERYPVIGGVCLNVGCIPSKALLHMSVILNETRELADHGLKFAEPEIDLDKLRDYKNGVIKKLTGGLAALAKQRKVDVVQGYGRFTSPHTVEVELADGGTKTISFDNAIIAAGSQPIKLPFIPHDDPRVMDSTDALELPEVPKRMLVIGGGIIGLEMAQVYDSLGAKITIVELGDTIIPGADKDLTKPLLKRIKKRYENIYLNAKVTNVEAKPEGLEVTFEGKNVPQKDTFDRILVAVGRAPNGLRIGAEKAGVAVDERGFIAVDERQRTNVPHIYAIGDIVGQPMLAHKAVHEGKVAAEVICGLPSAFTPMGIPSVAYTDPEVAWAGKTEEELKAEGVEYEKGVFPWAASGRSLSLGRDEGMTKALFDAKTHRILGCGIVGPNAGELIAEAMLAIEMGADMQDIGLTIHPHPTLSETFAFAAEMAEGTITDLIAPKKRK